MRRRVLMVVLAVVVHATLLGWLCWPLPRHVATHLPSPNIAWDRFFIGWALAHQSRALAGDLSSYADANIYHPDRRTLFYGEAGFGSLPIFAPVFLSTGNPTLALNAVLLLGVLATACALHAVVQRWTGSFVAGAIAGAAFVATPWVLRGGIVAAPNYAMLPYLPWIVVLAARPDTGRGMAARLAALVTVQGLTSVYVAVGVLVPLGVLGLARTARPATRPGGLRLLAALVAAVALLAIAHAGYAIVRAENPAWTLQSAWRLPGSVEVPLEEMIGSRSPTGVPRAVIALIVVGAALRWWRRDDAATPRALWLHGALWAVVANVISLRPSMTWHGHGVALPPGVVTLLAPFWEMIRFPERLAIPGLIGLAILAGAAAAEVDAWVAGRLARLGLGDRAGRAVSAVAVGALLVTFQPWSRGGAPVFGWFTGTPRRVYPIAVPPGPDAPFMALLSEPGGPLLELPIDAGVESETRVMYRSIFHRRALVNGYSGYWPAGFATRKRLALALPDPAALAELRAATGLELILVHAKAFRAPPRKPRWRGAPAPHPAEPWLALAAEPSARTDLRLIARDGDDLLFRVEDAAAE